MIEDRHLAKLKEFGFFQFSFDNLSALHAIQELFQKEFPETKLPGWGAGLAFETYVEQVNEIVSALERSGLVAQLLTDNAASFERVLGPDIDIQARPHVRVSRVGKQIDGIGWHRDTFYGSSPYELNCWFPVFDLPKGSGLQLVQGSHLKAPKTMTQSSDRPHEHQAVVKGSVANQVGFLYQPMVDEVIENLKEGDATLVSPKLGDAILFFASCIHCGKIGDDGIRISIDVRVRSPYSPTNTKTGYYVPLQRGVVDTCAHRYLQTT